MSTQCCCLFSGSSPSLGRGRIVSTHSAVRQCVVGTTAKCLPGRQCSHPLPWFPLVAISFTRKFTSLKSLFTLSKSMRVQKERRKQLRPTSSRMGACLARRWQKQDPEWGVVEMDESRITTKSLKGNLDHVGASLPCQRRNLFDCTTSTICLSPTVHIWAHVQKTVSEQHPSEFTRADAHQRCVPTQHRARTLTTWLHQLTSDDGSVKVSLMGHRGVSSTMCNHQARNLPVRIRLTTGGCSGKTIQTAPNFQLIVARDCDFMRRPKVSDSAMRGSNTPTT